MPKPVQSINGDISGVPNEIGVLHNKLKASSAPDELKKVAENMITRLVRMTETGVFSKEYDILSNYIDWITRFPWNKRAEENLHLNHVS